jgi:hypothetical protein
MRTAILMLAATVLALVAGGCASDREPEIVAGVDGCAACGMVIDQVDQAAGYYLDKDFHTFCSPGCLLGSFEKRRQAGEPLPDRILFGDYAGGGLQPAGGVTFLLTEHTPTVMGWGILAFADPGVAATHRRHDDESLVDWIGLRTARGKVDRTLSLVLTGDAMEPPVIEVDKGELIEWELRGRELSADLTVAVRGYDELGEVTVPASGDPVRARMLALRPGAGFPLVRTADGEVLGQIRVRGAHTADEEAM